MAALVSGLGSRSWRKPTWSQLMGSVVMPVVCAVLLMVAIVPHEGSVVQFLVFAVLHVVPVVLLITPSCCAWYPPWYPRCCSW